MRIAMPSPNGTNRARLFIDNPRLARLAYDSKYGLRGLGRDAEPTREADEIEQGLSKISAMCQGAMTNEAFGPVFDAINELKDRYAAKLGEHEAALNQRHVEGDDDVVGTGGKGNPYPPKVGAGEIAKDSRRPSFLHAEKNASNASHKRLRSHMSRIGTV